MFYGWKIAGTGLFGNFMLFGGMLYLMNVFIEPLSDLYGWSRASISFSMGLASMLCSATMFVSIALAAYFKLRTLTVIGALLGGISLIGMGLTSNFVLFTVFFSVAWASGQFCGGAIANILVSNWFTTHRGRALGIVNMGTSLSGAILPFFCLILLEKFGIHMAYIILGMILLAFAPICYFIVRDEPRELNLNPDNKEIVLLTKNVTSADEEILQHPLCQERKYAISSFFNFYKNKISWYISLGYALGLLSVAGVISQLKPRFVEMGFDPHTAMLLMSLTALFGACGKYFWGYVSDKTNPILVIRLLLLGNIFGIGFLLLPASFISISIVVIVFGLCMGGMWTIFAALIYYIYGKECFKKAYQYASIMIVLKSIGYMVTGFVFTYLGSYTMAYIMFIFILMISCGCMFLIKKSDAVEYTL